MEEGRRTDKSRDTRLFGQRLLLTAIVSAIVLVLIWRSSRAASPASEITIITMEPFVTNLNVVTDLEFDPTGRLIVVLE